MRLIAQHLAQVAKTLKQYSAQCGIADHSGAIGAAREGLTTHFLNSHLADSVRYVTGEVFDCNDTRSGQMDIVLYSRSAPRLNLFGQINVVFADWVLAGIEVKSTLSTASLSESSHLRRALDACVRLKRLKVRSRGKWLGADLQLNHIPYIIFAYDGPTADTLRQKLFEYVTAEGLSLDMMPDLITVLNRDYYLMKNNGWLIPKVPDERVGYTNNSDPDAVLFGLFAYLCKLIEAHSMEPRATPFSDYCRTLH